MKQHLIYLRLRCRCALRQVGQGLAAVAILLGFLVMTMYVIRAQESMPDVATPMPDFYQVALGE